MIYAFLAVQSAVLIIFGYIFVCRSLGNKQNNSGFSAALSKNRIIYLFAATTVSIVLMPVLVNYYSCGLVDASRLMCLIQIMFPIAAIDLKKQIIPNKLLLALLILRIIIFGAEALLYRNRIKYLLSDYLLGALCLGGFFMIMLAVFKNGIGMGDVKLFAVMGLYQGLWGAINSVCFSLAVSFVIAIALLISKRKSRKDVISFGPSILAGTVIAVCLSGI